MSQGLGLAYFLSASEKEAFRCIYSGTANYQVGERKFTEEIPSLLRFLCKKAHILSNEVQTQLDIQTEQEILLILAWENTKRMLIVAPINENKDIDQLKRYLSDKEKCMNDFLVKLDEFKTGS